MAETLSLTGIDGSGKTTTAALVARRLALYSNVGVLSSLRHPSYILVRGQQLPIAAGVTHALNSMYEAGQKYHLKPLLFVSLMNFIAVRERLIRPYLIKRGVDFIIGDRDPLVDPLAIFMSYWGQGLPIPLMVNTLEIVGGRSITDNLFWLTVSPEMAVRRLSTGHPDGHETPSKLQALTQIYPRVIDALVSMNRIRNLTTVDTELCSPGEVADNIIDKLK